MGSWTVNTNATASSSNPTGVHTTYSRNTYNYIYDRLGIGYETPSYKIQLDSDTYGSNSGWTSSSNRNVKTNFVPLNNLSLPKLEKTTWTGNGYTIDALDKDASSLESLDNNTLLNRLSMLPLYRYSFINDDEFNAVNPGADIYHIGPTAQDFYTSFGLGGKDTSIRSSDLASVALSGVQALHNKAQQHELKLNHLDTDLNLTATGNVGVGGTQPTSSAGLDAATLESLNYSVKDATTDATVERLSNFSEVAAGKVKAGLVKTSSVIAENAVVTRAKIADLTATSLNSASANISNLTASTLESVKATIDELTARQINIGNFVLVEQDGKLQIQDKNKNTIASFDQDGNATVSGDLTADSITADEQTIADPDVGATTSSQLGELIANDIQTTTLTATGSTQLGSLIAEDIQAESVTADTIEVEEVTTDNLVATDITAENIASENITGTGTTQLGSLIADSANIENINTNQMQTISLEVEEELRAQSSRFQQLEAKLADLDEIKANTAKIVNGEIENVKIGSSQTEIAHINQGMFDQATFNTATISGTLYADTIAGFEEKVAQAFRQPSLLGQLLGSSSNYDEQNEELLNIVESAGYSAINSNQLRQSLADLELGGDDVVIAPAAAYINQYLEVNGTAHIGDSLAVNNYIVMGDGLKMAANVGMASIDYISSSDPSSSTLYIQPSGVGRINLMAGVMTIDSTGSVMVLGDMWIAGDLEVEGELRTNTLLTNLIEADNYDEPTQIRLGAYVDEDGNVIYGEVAGDSTENTELKQSRLEIIDEHGQAVATISATGRAEFADGLGIGQEDLTEVDDEIESVISHKTSGRAKVEAGQQHFAVRSSRITANSQIFVTPLGSTSNQVLYVKSQVPNDPTTEDVEGLFVVGFDSPATQDVLFNWWIVN